MTLGFSLILTDTSPLRTADFILDRAAAQGRNVERQRQTGAEAAARARLRAQLGGDAT